MTIARNQITTGKFNEGAKLPYELRLEDFKLPYRMCTIFSLTSIRILSKKDSIDSTRCSGLPSCQGSCLTCSPPASEALQNSRRESLLQRASRPRRQRKYPNNSIKAGGHGIEIKTTRKAGGAADTHGARDQWMCVFVYEIDKESEPTSASGRFNLPKFIWARWS